MQTLFVFTCFKRREDDREPELLLIRKNGRWMLPYRIWEGEPPMGDLEEWTAEALKGLMGFEEIQTVRQHAIGGVELYVVELLADRYQCLPEAGVELATWSVNPMTYLEGFSRDFLEDYSLPLALVD